MAFCRKCWIKVLENLITFFQNVFFIGCNISLSWYLHLKNALWGFNINHLIFGDKNVTVLVVHMWNWLPKSLKRLLRFKKWQKLKRLLSDWFLARCTQCPKIRTRITPNTGIFYGVASAKVAVIWTINSTALQRSNINYGFYLSYFRFLL